MLDATPRSEELDAEARRRVGSRYLAGMRTVLERHGATVEAYPGDALMAVFGVPLLHEDDALRAVRAAVEIAGAAALVTSSTGLGVRLGARVGVATGEVIAERRARRASAGDRRRGERGQAPARSWPAPARSLDRRRHARLVRDSVAAEPGPRTSSRLRRGGRTRADGAARARSTSPLVGRAQQLGTLSTAFAAATWPTAAATS